MQGFALFTAPCEAEVVGHLLFPRAHVHNGCFNPRMLVTAVSGMHYIHVHRFTYDESWVLLGACSMQDIRLQT